jgi:SOS-response transcriptional repressor LexA
VSTRSEVLRAIVAYKAKHDWAPSIAEIADAVGLSSTGNVHRHLKELERLGFIERGKHPRQIRLVGEREEK